MGFSMTIAYGAAEYRLNPTYMKNLEEMNTDVLKTIVAAYTASYYGKTLSEEEMAECKKTIDLIKNEIEAREQSLKNKSTFSSSDEEGNSE